MGVTFILDDNRKMRMPDMRMSEEEFFNFCAANPELPLERDRHGNILLMPPTGFESSRRESRIIIELGKWVDRGAGGYVLSSNGAVTLPNGAVRSPDGAWVSASRFEARPREDRERFTHVVPEFVAEIVSRTDVLREAKLKMDEYIENGVQLAFLIAPYSKVAWVYRADGSVSEHGFDETLSGEDVMPGFELPLKQFV